MSRSISTPSSSLRCASSRISRSLITIFTTFLLATQFASAHFEILYPPWRGNTLKDDMQWQYPCGGIGPTTNRTKWPITGGSISIMPGWNTGHPTAFFYINMGYGNIPVNHSNIMHGVFQMVGPSRDPFPGTFCLPLVSLPVNATQLGAAKVGLNATIQVIQTALHGASLYNCADITFVEPGQEDKISNYGGCINSTDIGFASVFTTKSRFSSGNRNVEPTIGLVIAVGILTLLGIVIG